LRFKVGSIVIAALALVGTVGAAVAGAPDEVGLVSAVVSVSAGVIAYVMPDGRSGEPRSEMRRLRALQARNGIIAVGGDAARHPRPAGPSRPYCSRAATRCVRPSGRPLSGSGSLDDPGARFTAIQQDESLPRANPQVKFDALLGVIRRGGACVGGGQNLTFGAPASAPTTAGARAERPSSQGQVGRSQADPAAQQLRRPLTQRDRPPTELSAPASSRCYAAPLRCRVPPIPGHWPATYGCWVHARVLSRPMADKPVDRTKR